MYGIKREELYMKLKSLFILLTLLVFLSAFTACSTDKPVSDGLLKTFTFEVYPQDGDKTVFSVSTTKASVGEALIEEHLITGETHAQFGLMVKTVNGILADWDENGTFWMFYIDDEMAMTGVDSTEVRDGAVYAFKQE